MAAAPLLLSVAIIAALYRHQSKVERPTRADIGVVILVAFLVLAPWHIASSLRHGMTFWDAYVGHHVGVRATTAVVPGISFQDLMYLVWRDWVLVIMACVAVLRGMYMRSRGQTLPPLILPGIIWAILAILPVSISSTRLPHYGFPFVIGLAMLGPAALPRSVWSHRFTPAVTGACVVWVLSLSPARIALWLNADLAPAQRTLGTLIAQRADDNDVVATYNTTTAALTFYSGADVSTYSPADPRFLEVQRAVLMMEMVGHVQDIGQRPIVSTGDADRFIVARRSDADAVIARLKAGRPERAISVIEAGHLVLVNDADLGKSIQ